MSRSEEFRMQEDDLLSSNDTHDQEDMQSEHFFDVFGCSISWLTFTFGLVGIFTNVISIYIYTHRVMRSPVNVLLAGLSAIDLVFTVCCIPSFVVPMWIQCYDSDSLQTVHNYFTVLVYPFAMMSQTASVLTFLVIAFERWIAVCHPLKARWCTIKRSYRALIAVIISATCYNVVRFFEYRLVYNEQNQTQLQLFLKNGTLYPAYMPVYYVAMYLVTHFLAPVMILICINGRMALSIVNARRQSLLLGRKQKREHKTTIMMGVVVLVFVLTNTLPFFLNFVEAVTPEYFYDDETSMIGFALLDLGNLLIVINTSTTAFIYYACSQRYRRLLLYTWHRLFFGFKYFPFKSVDARISTMNGGYSLANATCFISQNAVFTVAPKTSVTTLANGQVLPNKYYKLTNVKSSALMSPNKPSQTSTKGSLVRAGTLTAEEPV